DNILLNDEDSVKLSDFGVNKILDKLPAFRVCTLRYMAHEMFLHKGHSYPADI
ncbi:Mitogen-activated protein kinase kinase kinase npk1, partial [Biomphalaria glabrata]